MTSRKLACCVPRDSILARRSIKLFPCLRLCAGGAEAAANRGFPLLIEHDQVALDLLLAVLLDLVGDFARARDDVTGPYARGEAHLEAAHVADPDVIGDGLREQARGVHPLREDGRDSGRLDEGLIVMQW